MHVGFEIKLYDVWYVVRYINLFNLTDLIQGIMGQCIGRGSDDPFNDIHPHIFSVLNIDENGR